jgi:hypothetical protein
MKIIKYQPSNLNSSEIDIKDRLKNLDEQYSLIVLRHNKSYLTEAITVRFYSTNTKTSCVIWNNLYHANSSAKVVNTKSTNPKLDTLITALAKMAIEFDGKRDTIEDYLNTIAYHEGYKTYMIIRANA